MPKVAVYNLEGSQTGELTLSDEIFASDINKAPGHKEHSDSHGSPRRRQEALPPEGHGPRPPGFNPRSSVHKGRRSICAQAPFFQN